MNLIYNKTGKDYGNGILNFAHRYPIIGLIVLPILFDWPAKAVQAGVRTAKYGDPRLGSAPLAMEMEDGTGTSGISLFGNLTKQGGHFDEGPQFLHVETCTGIRLTSTAQRQAQCTESPDSTVIPVTWPQANPPPAHILKDSLTLRARVPNLTLAHPIPKRTNNS